MIGTGELIVILCIILLLFGGKKLPDLARSLGVGIREFKKACQGEEDSEDPASKKEKQSKPVIIEVFKEEDDSQK